MKAFLFGALIAIVLGLVSTLYSGCGNPLAAPAPIFPSSFQFVVPQGVQQ
jgi:hypothetical protein